LSIAFLSYFDAELYWLTTIPAQMRLAKIHVTKKIVFALMVIMQLVISTVTAQTFQIQSLQGKPVAITLHHQPASEKLLITSLNDSIQLKNFWSLDTIIIQDNKFLKIEYDVRVGSNNGSINQVWLFADHGQLKQALYIESFREYDYRPYDYRRFKVSTKLSGGSVKDYRLTLNIKKLNQKSGRTISNINKTDHLRFDIKAGCFYNDSILLKGKYTFRRINSKLKGQRFLSQTVPVVNILKNKYYFISNNWYTRYKGTFYAMGHY
jgi:hypothetical protein